MLRVGRMERPEGTARAPDCGGVSGVELGVGGGGGDMDGRGDRWEGGGGKAYGWTEVFLEVYYYECRFECWFRHYGVVDVC